MTQPTDPTSNPAPLPAPPPMPVPAPPLPAPQPIPAPPPAPGPTTPPIIPSPGAQLSEPGTGDELPYYQEGVPWRQLPADQQVAYWMHRSRKHESRVQAQADYEQAKGDQQRYQELLTQTQTERERDIAEARRQGETTAMGRANSMLVEAYVRSAAAARGVDGDVVTDLLDTLDRSKFVSATTGLVDTAKVYGLVNRMVPAAPAAPAAGVPAAPAPAPVVPATPAGWPGQPPAQQQWPAQPVPAAPQWPGQVPAAPAVPGVPAPAGGPDFGQGSYGQAPPSGLEAGRAAARAMFGTQQKTTNPQAA